MSIRRYISKKHRKVQVIFLLFLYFFYLSFGAAVISVVECKHEEKLCVETIAKLKKYNLSDANNNVQFNNGSLNELVELLLTLNKNGVQMNHHRELSCVHNWSYQNAFLFVGTVITTIGYGHISPFTVVGRVFCIVFAIIGLPIFAIMFRAISSLFIDTFNDVVNKQRNKESGPSRCSFFLVFVCTVVFALLIPSILFMNVEEWTFFEAFYYSFITVTTIGLGDYVVGINPDLKYFGLYRVMVYFWMLFGLSFMSAMVRATSEILDRSMTFKSKQKSNKETHPLTEENNSEEIVVDN